MGKMPDTVSTQDNAGLLVLAVDDEAPGLSEIKYLLESSPLIRRVLTAFDAAEALRILRGDYEQEVMARTKIGLPPVDAVFADINMPGLSGMDLARVLSAFRHPPALVFVTGVEERDALVNKPINEERVLKAISRVADRVGRTAAPQAPAAATAQAVAAEPTDDEVIPVELGGTIKLVPRASVRSGPRRASALAFTRIKPTTVRRQVRRRTRCVRRLQRTAASLRSARSASTITTISRRATCSRGCFANRFGWRAS